MLVYVLCVVCLRFFDNVCLRTQHIVYLRAFNCLSTFFAYNSTNVSLRMCVCVRMRDFVLFVYVFFQCFSTYRKRCLSTCAYALLRTYYIIIYVYMQMFVYALLKLFST